MFLSFKVINAEMNQDLKSSFYSEMKTLKQRLNDLKIMLFQCHSMLLNFISKTDGKLITINSFLLEEIILLISPQFHEYLKKVRK